MMKKIIINQGFSLIELVVFIVVMGLVAVAIMVPLNFTLQYSANPGNQMIALMLAQERMELIIGQYRLQGYSSYSDLCKSGSPPAICTLPASLSSYTVNSAITTVSTGQQIVVTVTGPGTTKAVLTTQVGNV